MTKTLSLRDANQSFARCVREVEGGEEIVITRRGTPVARLVPIGRKKQLTPEQEAAWANTVANWQQGWPIVEEPFDRDALHER